MSIDLVLPADYAGVYIAQLVADVLGSDAEIDVTYSEPDTDGLVWVIGEARTGG